MLSKEKIIEQIENLSTSDIVHAAMEGWKNGGKFRDGYCVYNYETGELESVTLGQNEEIIDDERIYLLKVPENILGNNGYEMEDWLTLDEIDDMKKKEEEGEYLSPEDYIEKYTDDTVEERLEEILLHYFEEDGLDWDSIESQLEEI